MIVSKTFQMAQRDYPKTSKSLLISKLKTSVTIMVAMEIKNHVLENKFETQMGFSQ